MTWTADVITRLRSKQATVLALLNRPSGRPLRPSWKRPAGRRIRCAASWPGVVRKRLALTMQAEKADGERTYQVIDNDAEASTSSQPQAA